ncbi:hypothetical protein ACTXT7_003665 [Hymenolepis weldensis]
MKHLFPDSKTRYTLLRVSDNISLRLRQTRLKQINQDAGKVLTGLSWPKSQRCHLQTLKPKFRLKGVCAKIVKCEAVNSE